VRERIRQLMLVWRQLKQVDPRAVIWVGVAALLGVLVAVGLSWLIGWWWAIALVPLSAMMSAMIVFSRRAQRAQYAALDGQVGAAAAVLNTMRGQWFVSPAVAFNKQQDLVHRVVGRCGVVLVGEGSRQRVKGLLARERKRLSRVTGEIPLHTVVVGDDKDKDEVPINKLQGHLTKLPRKLKKTEVPKLERKLKPLDQAPPIPPGVDPNAMNKPRPKPR
jgi:hypothetical protein